MEKEMATHCSILAWRIPWTEEPGGLQSMGLRRVGHNWALTRGLRCSVACGIFLDQGLNPCLLHWQADSLPLSHQGSWSSRFSWIPGWHLSHIPFCTSLSLTEVSVLWAGVWGTFWHKNTDVLSAPCRRGTRYWQWICYVFADCPSLETKFLLKISAFTNSMVKHCPRL